MQDDDIKKLLGKLAAKGLKVATAESLTCGLIGATLTRISGASAVVNGGMMVYSDRMKHLLLGVPEDMLAQHTAVSEPVARAMALGALERTESDIAVTVTGYAGGTGGLAPASDEGLVYIGLAWIFNGAADAEANVFRHQFPGGRDDVRRQTVDTALSHLGSFLDGLQP